MRGRRGPRTSVWDRANKLRADPKARLKWLVLKRLGALPSQARGMRDEDYLFCALNMLLDKVEAGGGDAAGVNPNFDYERFQRMKGGGGHEN